MATSAPALARCTGERACPRRWADGGPDRNCGHHAEIGGAIAERMTAMGIDMAPRGRHGDGDGDGTDGQAKDGQQAGGQQAGGQQAGGRDPAPATVTRTNKHGVALR